MLEATRTRLSFSGEVLAAATLLVATVLVGSLIVRELAVAPGTLSISTPASTPGQASSSPSSSTSTAAGAAAPDAVPPEAVSVPSLMFGAHEIKVGDPMASAVGRLDASIKLAKRSVETGPLGQREIRSYELSGMRFILVAEPFERGGEPRLSAIYLQ